MSKLTDFIVTSYSYTTDDVDDLTRRLNERRRATWINTLMELAQKHGCGQLPGTPKGADAKYLLDISIADAKSIARTYNRELANFIDRLYAENPKANRNTYAKRINQWMKRRDSWKTLQIGLQTDSTARQYAQLQFYNHNTNLVPKFRYSPIPPVSKECIARTAAGVVSFHYVQTHPTPAHISCPHQWLPIAPAQAECGTLWLG